MIEVKPKVFLKLFELLWQKFSSEDLSNSKVKPTNVLDIWQSKKANKQGELEYATQISFDSSPKYFYNLNTAAKKGGTVSVKENRLAKAIIYIDETFKEKIINKRYNPIDNANLLLTAFTNKYVPEESQINHVNLEKTTLEAHPITIPEELPEFKIVTKLILDFYVALQENRFFDAWELLTPSYKLRSYWRGDFDLFKKSFTSLKSVTKITYFDLLYSYGHLEMRIHYWETRFLYDMHELFLLATSNSETPNKNTTKFLFEKVSKILKDIGYRNFGKIDNRKIFKDYEFQRLIYIKSKIPDLLPKAFSEQKTEKVFTSSLVIFKFIESKWRIDYIERIEPNCDLPPDE